MQKIRKQKNGALILFTLFAALSFVPNQARAEEPGPVVCGGTYGYSYGEPFWVGDVWSIQVTAFCSDGSTVIGIGPVGADGGFGDGAGWGWQDGGEDDDD